MGRPISTFILSLCLWIQGTISTSLSATTPWHENESVKEIEISSSVDSTLQKAIWRPLPYSKSPRPLLVSLHSWSGNYLQPSGENYLVSATLKNWHFIHPDFRGINQAPQATCSDLVVSDVLDAVEFARAHSNVDDRHIYLVGASGGGMASLMLAAKAPHVWAAVSAWVPISNLADWHAETMSRKLKYTAMIEASCGGKPGTHAAVDFQYWNRSPIHFLFNARNVRMDINAGIMDGHTGSVPVGHTLRAFNALAAKNNQFSKEQINFIQSKATIPDELVSETELDPSYGEKQPLLRRQSGSTRVTLFQGSHEIIVEAAMEWLDQKE